MRPFDICSFNPKLSINRPASKIDNIKATIISGKFFLYEKSYFFSNHTAKIIPTAAMMGIHQGKVERIDCNLHDIRGPFLLIRKALKFTKNIIPMLKPTNPENSNSDPATKYHLGFIVIFLVFIWEIISVSKFSFLFLDISFSLIILPYLFLSPQFQWEFAKYHQFLCRTYLPRSVDLKALYIKPVFH